MLIHPNNLQNPLKRLLEKMFESFIKMLGKFTFSEDVAYFSSDESQENVEELDVEEAIPSTCDEEYMCII